MLRTSEVASVMSQLTNRIISFGALTASSSGSNSWFMSVLTGPGIRTKRARLVAKHVRSARIHQRGLDVRQRHVHGARMHAPYWPVTVRKWSLPSAVCRMSVTSNRPSSRFRCLAEASSTPTENVMSVCSPARRRPCKNAK